MLLLHRIRRPLVDCHSYTSVLFSGPRGFCEQAMTALTGLLWGRLLSRPTHDTFSIYCKK